MFQLAPQLQHGASQLESLGRKLWSTKLPQDDSTWLVCHHFLGMDAKSWVPRRFLSQQSVAGTTFFLCWVSHWRWSHNVPESLDFWCPKKITGPGHWVLMGTKPKKKSIMMMYIVCVLFILWWVLMITIPNKYKSVNLYIYIYHVVCMGLCSAGQYSADGLHHIHHELINWPVTTWWSQPRGLGSPWQSQLTEHMAAAQISNAEKSMI